MDEHEGLPGDSGGNEPPAGTPPASGSADTSLPPEAVRNSPEYKALQERLRSEARRRGDAERQAADARAQLERTQQDTEANRQAQLQAQINEILGQEGLADWQEFAELSERDPIEAAKKLRAMRERTATPAPQPGEGQQNVATTQQQPQAPSAPPPPRTLGGDAPLSSVADNSDAEEIAELERTWSDVVEKNRTTPNRITDRDRQRGLMAYMQAGYRKVTGRR